MRRSFDVAWLAGAFSPLNTVLLRGIFPLLPDGRYAEQPRYVVTSNSSRNTRVVAMIPFEEKPESENAGRHDGADMPELIQNDVREGERPADNDADEGEIDIETYEEDNSTDGHKPGTIWIETKDVDCHERLGTLERLCEHMFQVHRAPTEIKRKVFDTEAQFEEFLRELESRGGNFRMSRGNKTIKEGIVQYFRCNRIFSIAKDKALRIVDDITAGTYEAVKDITQPMDPFGKETSTKPYLRTEEACTAFFRKTYLNDGTIEVRYCDHHLHGDERLRLPTAIRNRIHEMMKKRLPLPVIVMVLQRECHRFCMPGTALERRIMAVTPREVQLVAQSVQRRIDAASKRKRAVESQSGISQNSYETGEDVNEGRREDDEAAENIIERADDQDSHVANEHLMDVAEEDTTTSGSIEDNMSLANEGRGEGGELTEVELAMLEEYEQNRGVILTDFQSLKREENRKSEEFEKGVVVLNLASRLCRERVRAKIYTLGRAMRNIQFSDFECDLLIRSEEMLESVVELWNARMDATNKQNKELDKSAGQRQMVVGAADSKHDLHPGSECTSDPTSPTHTTGSANTTTDAGAEEEPDAQRDAERDTAMVEHSDLSQAVASAAEPPQDAVASPSIKPKAKARPRRAARIEKPEKTVKEEFPPKPSTPTVSPPALPAISRLGRVIKKKKILDV
ncbi:unnamed protein product [Heligmosomoides polygyrus]|uniref:C2H2-type domain-containing protein n=1 Tax=Heligmosomoides polygyrus TaxID=6339 RepID=A0A183G9D1_HELPZ|nr:unnamed protein product [Heligmosomoides polygyrus]